jgi:multiple sugar transport system substrate-binding protein
MPARAFLLALCIVLVGCTPARQDALTISASAVGREADVLRAQLTRFSTARGIQVALRPTPDAADQRHQLYVQWLNARAPQPDVLQIDVVWTPEFGAAGWLAPLDRFQPSLDDFLPAAIEANRWNGTLFGVPWFVDAGMLYWRTDVLDHAPATFEELTTAARQAMTAAGMHQGLALQAAHYEGLVTVFLEVLGGFGGSILDKHGEVVVDSDAAVRALTWLRDAIHVQGIVPSAALTWHEAETRFAFQNGAAAMMRNWPYASALLRAPDSLVAHKFGVAPMPAAAGGRPTAALGGSQLGINAHSRRSEEAWALIEFLTAPEQMIERARMVGQFPSRRSVYSEDVLDDIAGVGPSEALRIVSAARPRPVTPVYTQLSEILQIHLHRALTQQQDPRTALESAAREMRALLARAALVRS